MSAPLYSYYGDDFTGSTDVLEGLAAAGLRGVLFQGMPSEERRRQFSDCQAIGIAGDSRSRSPAWMSEHLPGLFACLRSFGAPVVHYKTCSTFDSSPQMGSIGRAMEIGHAALPAPFIPIVVGAPHLKRYVAFGNLFAASGDVIYRIDRHPTMRQHPVTPMYEADLRRHLAAQTGLKVGLIDGPTLRSGGASQALATQIAAGVPAVLFDGMDAGELEEAGRLVWEYATRQPLFAVGSSGLTYALASAWRKAALIPNAVPNTEANPVDRMLVMSGSCSPVTERQIRHALQNGYVGIAIDSESAAAEAIEALRTHGRVVVYSSLGPLPVGAAPRGDELGRKIGRMTRAIIAATGIRRVLLAGGDTSSHAVTELGIDALTWVASTQPGAPICRVHARAPELDGLELVLKGGQVGTADFFERVRAP